MGSRTASLLTRASLDAGPMPATNWGQIPRAVRRAVEAELGGSVLRSRRLVGGFAPSAVFRLKLDSGLCVVAKASDLAMFPVLGPWFEQETRFYCEAAHLVSAFVPRLHGAIRVAAWRVLILDHVGGRAPRVADRNIAVRIAEGLAQMHRATVGSRIPTFLPRRAHLAMALNWRTLLDTRRLRDVARFSGDEPPAVHRWLQRHARALQRGAEGFFDLRPRRCLLHGDARSDNVRIEEGRFKIFDWPFATVGPPELDAAFFAQTVACDSAIDPEDLIAAYRGRLELRDDVLDCALAALSGLFAARSFLPEVLHAPGLRAHQRKQMRVTLSWLARRWRLPAPPWSILSR